MRTLFIAGASSFLVTALFMVIFVCFFGSYSYIKAELPAEVMNAMTDGQKAEWNASSKVTKIAGVEFIKMAAADRQTQLALAKSGFVIWLSSFFSAIFAIFWSRRRVNA